MQIFTYSERTVKKYTVNDAVNQALMVLKHKHRLDQICTDKVQRYLRTEAITLEKMSQLVDDLIFDTLYWAGL